jgi:hypothetical protein
MNYELSIKVGELQPTPYRLEKLEVGGKVASKLEPSRIGVIGRLEPLFVEVLFEGELQWFCPSQLTQVQS